MEKKETKAATINRFVIMCVEQYAAFSNQSSASTYKEFLENDIISELENDYEDLHGMSTIWLNEYINGLLNKR